MKPTLHQDLGNSIVGLMQKDAQILDKAIYAPSKKIQHRNPMNRFPASYTRQTFAPLPEKYLFSITVSDAGSGDSAWASGWLLEFGFGFPENRIDS